MLFRALCLSLASCVSCLTVDSASDSQSVEADLIKTLTNNANLDLPADEEYEDLRAELLAYNTALNSLVGTVDKGTGPEGRRSVKSHPCWELGGICVRRSLCDGHHYDFQVRGCRDQKNVCCFAWNQYRVRPEKGIAGPGYPWRNNETPFQGKGVVIVTHRAKGKKKQPKKTTPDPDAYDGDTDNVVPQRLKGVKLDSGEGLVVVDID